MAEGVAPEIKHLISWISEGSFRTVCTVCRVFPSTKSDGTDRYAGL